MLTMLLMYIKAFAVGGLFCLVGQILIDKTKLTPARILVGYVVTGVILGALGLYQPIIDFAGAGASVPLHSHRRIESHRRGHHRCHCFWASCGNFVQTQG